MVFFYNSFIKMTILWSFSYNSLVKFYGKNLEPVTFNHVI